jgi:hypothetical protein
MAEPTKSEFDAPSGLKLYAEVRLCRDVSPLARTVPLRCAALSPRGLASRHATHCMRPWRGMPWRALFWLRRGFARRH